MKYILLSILYMLFVAITLIQTAQAWTLTINVRDVQFGHRSIFLDIQGPYGYKDSTSLLNSPNPVASLTYQMMQYQQAQSTNYVVILKDFSIHCLVDGVRHLYTGVAIELQPLA